MVARPFFKRNRVLFFLHSSHCILRKPAAGFAEQNGRIAVKMAAGYIHDFVRKFFGVGFMLGSRCGSLAVGARPVDAYIDGGRGDGP